MPLVAYPIDDGREVEKFQNGSGIGETNAPAYTLDTRQHASVATQSTVRRLTPVECERLQGFPDNWTAGQTDGHRYKQMGNAVAVPVVQWIIDRIVSLND
jgi:DNA (cytosine-5)-methyltransferase 1